MRGYIVVHVPQPNSVSLNAENKSLVINENDPNIVSGGLNVTQPKQRTTVVQLNTPRIIVTQQNDKTVVVACGDINARTFADNASVFITVYAWEEDPGVTFETISKTVVVDPRSYPETVAGAQTAADVFVAQAAALQSNGLKAAFRYWQWDVIADGAILDTNWWETLEPYDSIPVGVTLGIWWDAFNARVISNGITLDQLIFDEEDGLNYFKLPDIGTRQSFFMSVTTATGPYPNDPNPYIDSPIWDYNGPLTDQFIQEWNQDAAEKRNTFLKSISDGCPVTTINGNRYISNYNDYLQDYEIGNLRSIEDRLPAEQVRMSNISSTPVYLDYSTAETLTDPPAEYTAVRQLVNRRRWQKMIWRLNKVKSALSAGSRCVPWIAPPGYGAYEANSWASATILPFEKLLWRVKMRHLRAMGIDTFILWNPVSNNPNSKDTDAFVDSYFTELSVRNLNSTIAITSITADSIVTNDRETSYDDLYRITNLVYQRSESYIVPYSQGFGTQDEPLIINEGTTGDAEVTAFLAALETVYGTGDAGGDDGYSEPTMIQINDAVPESE